MKLPFYIARRYLVSKKSANIVNLISGISVAGVAIGTMALIVVLSAFNGIDSFIEGSLSSFDPDLKITVAQGKSFSLDDANFDAVKKLRGIEASAEVVEGNALLRYEDRQKYATVKGVEDNYSTFSGLDSMMIDGQFLLHKNGQDCAAVGQGVKIDLSVIFTLTTPIQIVVPKRDFKNRINMDQSINRGYVFPTGSFSVEQEIDNKYILVPIAFARRLFELDGRLSSLELKINEKADPIKLKGEVQKILGSQFVVQDRYEQHAFLYRVMRSEKWTSFLILSFILVIASFNLLGSLIMIILDKKNDIKILESMGANKQLIRRIFLFEGWMISFSGAISGLLLGIGLVWAQTRFELLKLPSTGSFALSAYPVELHFIDVLATFLIVLLIGFFAAWYPVRSLSDKS